ncbi:hypothetical protein BDA99DRAFT_524618 [Phascolomyces articulosus]|uniref:rRNA biogenesis protein RRP36 n=1 Tax=Phascolomyces articulosus TaxID=60185 RepID=A0AAD5P908_9FUNG|nr:hypothetical protein BDA99DRAFT_524618 [Phascolomyces articulosus]
MRGNPKDQYSEEEEFEQEEMDYSDNDEEQYQDYSQDEEEEDDDDDDSQDEQPQKAKLDKLKRSLAHVSFEQLTDVKNKIEGEENDTSSSLKVSKEQIMRDVKGAIKKLGKDRIRRTKRDMKRDNSNSPMEVSSKKAVSRYREVVPTSGPKKRDPRFDKLSGQLNQDLFEKSYSFLDDYKKSEQDMLRKSIKKEKNQETRTNMESLLTKMVSREATEKQTKRKQQLLRERKKAEAELVKQGKKPYFLKRSEERKLELMDKYQQLGEKNMDKILAKRRKKNAAKDHRRVPFKRRSE